MTINDYSEEAARNMYEFRNRSEETSKIAVLIYVIAISKLCTKLQTYI